MAGTARVVTITALGNTKDLEAAFQRAGTVVSDASTKMADSAKRAGEVAAQSAKQMGASADEQAAAAGKAAEAYQAYADSLTRSQKVAGAASAAAARSAGASADEQAAAYARAAEAANASADEQAAASGRTSANLDKATGKTSSLVSHISSIGKYTTLAVAGAAVGAVKLGDEFESAGAKIQGATGISTKAADSITHAFAGTSGQFQTSGEKMEAAFAEVAGQLKVTEGHTLNATESLKFMASAQHLAEASGQKLGVTTGALSSLMMAYHLSLGHVTEASDILYNTSKSLATSPEQVATAMGRLHSKLGEVAPSMQDISGLMVALATHGVQGSRGLLTVNTAFSTLLGGSEKVTEVLKSLGVNLYNQEGKFVGLKSVIQQVGPKLQDLTEKQRLFAEQALFGKGAYQVLGQVMQAGVPAFERSTRAATEQGTALKAAKLQQETLSGTAHTLLAAIETLGGSFGLMLLPPLKSVAGALSTAFTWLEKNEGVAKVLGGVIASVLGVAVAVFAEQKAVMFYKAVATMGTDMYVFGQRVAGSAAGVVTDFRTMVTGVTASEDTMVEETDAAAVSMKAALITTGIGAALVAVGVAAVALQGKWKSAMGGMEDVAKEAANAIITSLNAITSVIHTITLGLVSLGKIGKLQVGESQAEQGMGKVNASIGHADQRVLSTGGGIMGFFENKGLSPAGAAAIVGNFQQESSLTSTDTGPSGLGFAQYMGSRRTGAESFARSRHEPITSATAQLEWTWRELQKYPGLLQELKTTTNPRAAAFQWQEQFEHPEKGPTANTPGREQMAAEAFRAHPGDRGAVTVGGSSAVPSGSNALNKALKHLEWETSHAKEAKQLEKEAERTKTSGVSEAKRNAEKIAREHKSTREKAEGLTLSELEKVYGTELGSAATKGATKSGATAVSESKKTTTELKSVGKLLASELSKVFKEAAVAAEKLKKQEETDKTKGGNKLKTLEAAVQGGSITSLEKLTGVSAVHPNQGQGSSANKQFNELVTTLKDVHSKALTKLADQLVEAHKRALETLDVELIAEQEKANARRETLEATEMRDQTKLTEDMANRVVEGTKDSFTLIVDGWDEVTSLLKDVGTDIANTMAASATAIKDATAEMQQLAAAAVKGIQNTSQTEVDKLAERGLYGLNLVAQQQQVQLDEMKTGYDKQIAQAEAATTHAQTETDNAAAATQAIVDAVTIQQDALIGQSKTGIARIEAEMNAGVGATEKNLDEVTARTDKAVQQAENSYNAVATGTKSQQDAAQAVLEHAKAEQAKQVAEAEASVSAAKSASAQAVQEAQNTLAGAEAHAAQAEQEAQLAVTNAHGHAEIVIAEANKILTEASDKANVAEAEQQALVEKTKEEAATQYAGSGLQVNIMGIENTNAAAIAAEVGWELRTLIAA